MPNDFVSLTPPSPCSIQPNTRSILNTICKLKTHHLTLDNMKIGIVIISLGLVATVVAKAGGNAARWVVVLEPVGTP
jgi:hypothetical protein